MVKQNLNEAFRLHREGKSFEEISQQLPDVKLSSLKSKIYRDNKKSAVDAGDAPAKSTREKPRVSFKLDVAKNDDDIMSTIDSALAGFKPADVAAIKNQPSVAKPDCGAGRPAPQVVRRDTFLEGQSRARSSNRQSNLDSFISDMNIDFSPQSLNQVGKQFEQDTKKKTDKEVLGHTASWWTRPFRTKKTKTEEEQDEDDRLALVQKIRLYLLNFPDLEELHVVKPDKEKFLISLYSKKKGELEKTLNFLTFHTRNSISEKSTMGSAKTVLTIAGRTIEIILGLVGVKSEGLTNDISSDNDLDRCVREIIIENSINTLNYGPKTDALIRICTIVAKRDGMNRQVEYMQRTQTKKAPLVKPVPPAPPASPVVANYSDL